REMFRRPFRGTECELRRTPGPSRARRRRWTSFRSFLPSRAFPCCTRQRQKCVVTKPDCAEQTRAGADTETTGHRSYRLEGDRARLGIERNNFVLRLQRQEFG